MRDESQTNENECKMSHIAKRIIMSGPHFTLEHKYLSCDWLGKILIDSISLHLHV